MIVGIDHVQVLCPPGGEEVARTFWRDVVGLVEVPKPPELAHRGGAWFRCGSQGLHVGAEQDFAPARRAHPAIRIATIEAFDALVDRLDEAGLPVEHAVPPIARCRVKTADPFGNMIEFVVGTTG